MIDGEVGVGSVWVVREGVDKGMEVGMGVERGRIRRWGC